MLSVAQPLYPLVDRLLDGRLVALLTEKRYAGQTYDDIARWLATDLDVKVTAETVRTWCARLDIPAKAVAS